MVGFFILPFCDGGLGDIAFKIFSLFAFGSCVIDRLVTYNSWRKDGDYYS
jgi:hypothetical protein